MIEKHICAGRTELIQHADGTVTMVTPTVTLYSILGHAPTIVRTPEQQEEYDLMLEYGNFADFDDLSREMGDT